MKKPLFLLLPLLSLVARAQPAPIDTNYTARAVSIEWMPDGKGILLSVVKFHKTDRNAPFYSKVLRYDLSSKQLEPVMENAGNLAPSPDGNQIAYMRRVDPKRADIYIYTVATKQDRLLPTDTMRKNSLSWSPDGKKLLYNINKGSGRNGTVEICVYDLASGQIKQVTQSGDHKSYTPQWCPDSKKIVYYLEKGDSHDQIWLTDIDGSFHTNLTNDTSTHNYFPAWFDEKTILYTRNPDQVIMMNIDGSNKKKVEGIQSFQVKFSPRAGMMGYIQSDPVNQVVLFDWKKKTNTVILDEAGIKALLW
jgi:Tol biopolymer transport system component